MKTTKKRQLVRKSILGMATALVLLATGCGAATPSQSSSPAPATTTTTSTTNGTTAILTTLLAKPAVPTSIAAPPVSKLTPQQETFSKLAAQKGQVEGVDYTFTIDRTLAAQVNPGYGTFGAPVFNEQELVARLADGSMNSNRAIAAFQERELTKNGFTITRDEVLNAGNFQCAQMLKPNESGDMASVAANGTVNWAGDFVDPKYSVTCAYVGSQVTLALSAGHAVVAIGFRGNCINVQELPVIVESKLPTLPQPKQVVVTHQTPPPAHHEVMKACIKGSGDTSLQPVDKFDSEKMSTNPADCEKPPVIVPVNVLRCDTKTGTDNVSISEETAKDTDRYKAVGNVACLPVEVTKACIKGSGDTSLQPVDKFNPATMSKDAKECVKPPCGCTPPPPVWRCDISNPNDWKWVSVTPEQAKDTTQYSDTPEVDCVTPVVCVQADHPKPGSDWTWDQTKCEWTPPAPPVCVKADHPKPGSDWTWDEVTCKWCPPVIVSCPAGQTPNPQNPKECLNLKDTNPDKYPTDPGTPPIVADPAPAAPGLDHTTTTTGGRGGTVTDTPSITDPTAPPGVTAPGADAPKSTPPTQVNEGGSTNGNGTISGTVASAPIDAPTKVAPAPAVNNQAAAADQAAKDAAAVAAVQAARAQAQAVPAQQVTVAVQTTAVTKTVAVTTAKAAAPATVKTAPAAASTAGTTAAGAPMVSVTTPAAPAASVGG